MKKNSLGNSGIEVSCFGLGTMTFGEQNNQEEAFAQMDCALAAGINLFDTAEMYPVPPQEVTFTKSEKIIGKWMKQRKCRERLVLATKIVGPTVPSSSMGGYIRDGINHLTGENINKAIEGSLGRLGTDTIDLYQIHWPDRDVNIFGQRGFNSPNEENEENAEISETLETLENLRQSGKIRAFGVSNETPWGVMHYLSLAENNGWERIVSIQNPYNLLNRTFESGLAEITFRESVGLLAYSPLAFGALTGKYLDGLKPARARLTLYSRFQRYQTKNALKAIREYVRLAREYDLDPAQMALAFVRTRSFTTSVLLGATSVKQLESNLESSELDLSSEVIDTIHEIHKRIPNPCP
uniref:Protein tas n=1 Tax=uncultured delta proteobacterium HF0130_20J24 TaxID=710829 RepID=E0XXQ4_9DELT|nr:predicted oxidoreductases (related to aryl-alcohol dehydrogenases) [uncultured delta proteobacterium HF0130_20J24]